MNKQMADFLKESTLELNRHAKVLGGGSAPVRCSCGDVLYSGTGSDPYIATVLHHQHKDEVWLDLIQDLAIMAYNKGYAQAEEDHHATGFYAESKRVNPFETEK